MTAEDTFTILMVAKAPQPGLAKTRLCPPLTQDQAAAVAAAALLDSLATIRQAVLGQLERIVVSWEGEAAESIAPNAIGRALDGCLVVPQRGDSFAERLVHAHEDAAEARPGNIVVQVGMDTPHLSAEQLMRAARYVTVKGNQVVLGPATDGGWWLLGLSSPLFAEALRDVSMSTAKTGLDSAVWPARTRTSAR